MKTLVVDFSRCTGCRLCEISCSLYHDGAVNPAAARLAVIRWEEEGLHVPAICQQCAVAMCERVCQPGAIRRDEASGALLLDPERCIGCRMCIVACPYGAIGVHPVTRQVVKCDLCGGDPRCVRFCDTEALRFVEPETVSFEKQQATARKIVVGG